jgi:Zn-dependent protease
MTTGPHPDGGSALESGPGVRIARVGGIPVYLAPSWFLIAIVITVIVAFPVLDTDPLRGIGIGMLQALVLLASVLVHEAAHAVSARALGIPVVRIVANLWGGHTAMGAGRTGPGRMAVIALAGPLSNAVVAVAALAAHPFVQAELGARVLEGLIIINGSLAVLNILPGLPLDGGQVVESVVWGATGDRNRGLVVAGWCGRVLTLGLVFWFLARPLLQSREFGLNGIWILVIASVLWTGATDAIRRGGAFALVERLTVADIMERAVFLPPDTPLGAAIAHPDLVVTADHRGIPCLVLASIDGIVPKNVNPSAPLSSAVMRIPDENIVEAPPTAGVHAVLAAMEASGGAMVVLTAQGRPYGVASTRLVSDAAARN